MEVKVFSNSHYFKATINNHYPFSEGHICQEKDLDALMGYFDRKDAVTTLGKAKLYTLLNYPFLYVKKNIDSETEVHSNIDDWHKQFTDLFLFLWLVKDNSCNSESTLFLTEKGWGGIHSRDRFYSNASGEFIDTTFDNSNIKKANEYAAQYISAIGEKSDVSAHDDYQVELNNIGQIRRNEMDFVDYSVINRIERAFSFIQIARSHSILPAKVSYYVLSLECLFSGDDIGEIQHKIAQRIANYIGQTKEERKHIFSFIKTAYKVRSKYLHGQTLTKGTTTRQELIPISIELDDLLRRIIVKVFSNPDPFQKDSKQLKVWLDDQMFA